MVLDFLRKAKAETPERKASAGARIAVWGTAGRVAWTPRDTVSLTRNGFQGNPVGFRSVKLIAEAAAALPVICRDPSRRYEVHPVPALLTRPNPGQGKADLLEAAYAQLMLAGNAYVEAVPAEAGGVAELHVLRSDRMSLVPGSDGWPMAYDYVVGANRHRYAAEIICHIKTFHPQDDHYGLAPLQAAATALDVHSAAARWSKALLDNAARPSGAIVYRGVDGAGTMSEDQFARLQEELETHHQGARNAGRPMLLEGGLDWKPMGFSPSDMEFQKTKEAAARDIALAFGVPPMLLGIPGDATYANYAEANRAFYRLTVLPLAQKVLAQMGHWLSGLTGEAIELAPDLDQVPALAAEREAQWRRIAEADFLTEAEKRRMLGLPERPEGA
ncbi:phage portal protein [Roseicyclus persicicus]|uniref:Phage portal protein n=1 Tax=Roseicyclus persicicus TaxID=2650661 RepID=A0A7X6H358_9RHOB|nr:phage portal protein [Roseibacterium persicicum]NKX46298.1 phage portal protein [Roseibacterium persicicum]